MVDEVASDYENLTIDGRLNRKKLENENDNLAELLDKGICWILIRWEIAKRFPSLASFLQSALNAVGNIHQGNRFTQVLNNI